MVGARERQKQETRRLLLAAARDLFETRGFRRTTVKQVAEQAGVAVGTVFVHFPDKSALLAASLHDSLEAVVEEGFASLPDTGGIVARLLYFAEKLYRWYRVDVVLSRDLLKESLFLGGEWGERFRGLTESFVMRLSVLIEEAKVAGEVKEGVDAFLAALGFFSAYFTVLLGVVQDEASPLEMHLSMVERMIRFNLNLPSAPLLTVQPEE